MVSDARERIEMATQAFSNNHPDRYDESGHPMLGSALVCDPKFKDRVVAETRDLLATVRA
jgi:hypothetical protein